MKKLWAGLSIFIVLALIFSFESGFLGGEEPAAGDEKDAQPSLEEKECPAKLLREDTRLINVKGKIMDLRYDLKKSDYSRSVFVPKNKAQNAPDYFILLENRKLEEIEETTKHGETEVLVSGTVTVYNEKNYLLLTRTFVKQR